MHVRAALIATRCSSVHWHIPAPLLNYSQNPTSPANICLMLRPETVFHGASISLAHHTKRPNTSNIDRKGELDARVDKSSLKLMHSSPEQTKLQTAHAVLKHPVSLREDENGLFLFYTICSVQTDESIKMMRPLHNCFEVQETQPGPPFIQQGY